MKASYLKKTHCAVFVVMCITFFKDLNHVQVIFSKILFCILKISRT